MDLELRVEPFDGPAGTRLVADLTADLTRRYADDDEPPDCALDPASRAARAAAVADEEAGYAAELGPEDVVAPHGTFVVARLDGAPVGCAALKRHTDGVAEVKRVWVDPPARGRGVARALMARIEAEAVALGYRSVRLETGVRQPEAMRLYEALGYHRIEPYGRYRESPLTACYERHLDGSGLDRRTDPLTGRQVVIAASRQDRPNLPDAGCPFCPGGLEAPEPYEVRSFPNRWPPLGTGRAEVVLYTPDHDASFASLGEAGARRVVDVWAQRTVELGRRPDVAYVLVFENRGAQVGATISHPHGQVYGFPDVPDVPAAELSVAGPCPLCREPDPALLVHRHAGWRSHVPAAAEWPYAVLLAPDGHHPDLAGLSPADRDALASVLVDALGRLDRLFSAPMPYMLWVHQRPTDGGDWPASHVHVHVAPLLRAPGIPRYVAAGELGSGTSFNPVDPAVAAAALRAT